MENGVNESKSWDEIKWKESQKGVEKNKFNECRIKLGLTCIQSFFKFGIAQAQAFFEGGDPPQPPLPPRGTPSNPTSDAQR